MTDTEEVIVTEKEKPEIKIASVGAPQRAGNIFKPAPEVIEKENTIVEKVVEKETIKDADGKKVEEIEIEKVVPAIELTDEQIKELYFKKFPTEKQQTDAEKEAVDKAKEKRRLDLFISNGGTAEGYVAIKNVAAMDLKELSKSEVINAMKEAKFDDAEISEMLVERYYQINPDELEQGEEETLEEFTARKAKIEKKVAYGTAKLENRGVKTKQDAEIILNRLNKAIEEQDSEAKEEAEFTANVETLSTTLPRKITSQLGKLNDKDLGSVEIDVTESEIAEVVNLLKNPVQRNQLLYNEKGLPNEKRIAELLLKEKLFEKNARDGFLTGRTNQVEIFEKMFPNRNPNAIGVGGSPASKENSGNGKVASTGKQQKVRGGQF